MLNFNKYFLKLKNSYNFENKASQTKLFWFYLSRIITSIVFSSILVLINLLNLKNIQLKSIFIFILFYFIFNSIFFLIDKKGHYLIIQSTDIIFATILIYFTGSHISQFQFIYILIIIFGGFYLTKEKLYLLAAFSIISYITILNLEFFKIIPSISKTKLTTYGISYYIGIQFIAIFITSLIINKISDRLIHQTSQIQLKEKKFRDLMKMKNKIVDSVPSCMLTTNRDYSITFINEYAIDFFQKQCKKQILQGDNLINFFPIKEMLSNDDEIISRAEYTFETGEVIGYTITKMFSSNKFDGILMMFQDLTELKKLEKKVLFKNNLETLGEMAAGIAHEIRNPLASITGSVQLLKETYKESDDLELLNVIDDELKRIDESINNFLSFARNDNQEAKEENINKILKDVLKLFEKGLDSEIKTIVDFNKLNENYYAHCKKGRLKQVLWNILKNSEKAVEYSEIKKIYITTNMENNQIEIQIRDTGIGIKHNDLEKIFNPYFSNFAKGSGLGLSICKEIIEELNGKIEVTSTPGTGTCFNVIIPSDNIDSE